MQVYTYLSSSPLERCGAEARQAEELGYEGATVGESSHDPFLPLALAAVQTSRLKLGTSVAIAFPRSPMVVANVSWDLQALSRGRFELGLGTQVKGHNVRRFSVPWGPPIPRMREYAQALRAIWDCWQNGTKLRFHGDHYNFSLMTPMFNPGPIEHPRIPVLVAAVTPAMGRLAGEVMDGVLLHPLSSPKYLRDVLVPAIHEGARRAGRPLDGFQIVGANFIVTGRAEADLARRKEAVRRQIAFYASTRTYRVVMDAHGWGETADRLFQMSLQGQTGGGEGVWQEMARLITDEMLDEFAVIATYDSLAPQIRQRLGGLLTRIALPAASGSPGDREVYRAMVRELQSS